MRPLPAEARAGLVSRQRAIVIGGSVGGLFAAHLLRSVGWDAVVFERSPDDLVSRGAGIATHPQLIDIMARIGVAFDGTMGVKVDTVVVFDRGGRVVAERRTDRIMSAWASIYNALKGRLPPDAYRFGKSLVRVEQDPDVVTACFADGSAERAELLVGADGARSTVRELFMPALSASYVGYVAWRAMLDEGEVPAELRAAMFERFALCLPEGEMFIGYPVPGRNEETRVGRRAYNIVWYRPTDPDATLADLCTDANGRRHAAIPPPLIRPELIASIKATARAKVAPQLAEIFDRAQPFFQPILELASPQLVFGRVALLGDAAFVARPHAGAGTTKAALDAASLADALAACGLDSALERYEREQIRFGRGLLTLGRLEGDHLSAQLKPRDQRTAAELHWDVEGVIHAHVSRSAELRKVLDASRLGAVRAS